MSVYIILSCIVIIIGIGSTTGGSDSEGCKKATAEFEACRNQAYQNYLTAFQKGDDKTKPDWLARLSCTYLTESVETCANKLVGVCKTQETVDKQKDVKLEEALAQVTENIPSWNSAKCPAVKASLDRLAAGNTGYAGDALEVTGGATLAQISIFPFILLAFLI